MYETFYGLRERPFDLTPNPRYLFMTAAHREALTTIQYGVSGRKGITVLLGPAGTGKTSLVHAALEDHEDNIRILYLANPTLARAEFFQFFALECGLSEAAERSKTHMLAELRQWLLDRQANGGRTALIVDEAQAMPRELLEEVRLLTNLETSTEQLMSIVLVGQIELAERLNDPALRQFKQRIALRSKLDALSLEDTTACITERIRIAGGDVTTVFMPEAIADVFEASRGIPRTISVICDNALVSGFALDQRPIGSDVIAEVCRDFDFPVPRRRSTPRSTATSSSVVQTASAPASAPAPAAPTARPTRGSILMLSAPTVAPTSTTHNSVKEPAADATPQRGRLLSLLLGVSR